MRLFLSACSQQRCESEEKKQKKAVISLRPVVTTGHGASTNPKLGTEHAELQTMRNDNFGATIAPQRHLKLL